MYFLYLKCCFDCSLSKTRCEFYIAFMLRSYKLKLNWIELFSQDGVGLILSACSMRIFRKRNESSRLNPQLKNLPIFYEWTLLKLVRSVQKITYSSASSHMYILNMHSEVAHIAHIEAGMGHMCGASCYSKNLPDQSLCPLSSSPPPPLSPSSIH